MKFEDETKLIEILKRGMLKIRDYHDQFLSCCLKVVKIEEKVSRKNKGLHSLLRQIAF